jgi:cytochrome c oxidase subunit IV/LysM repeat protein
MAQEIAHKEGQQHPIKIYLIIWGWLFVLSICSYLVDYFGMQGFLRWFLILLFMIVKAGLIVAIFMHMAWERMALAYAILAPPGAVLLFVTIMAFESNYTNLTRVAFFGTGGVSTQTEHLASAKPGTETKNASTPSDKSTKEAEKNDLNVAKPSGLSEGRNVAVSRRAAAATGEAGKTVPASGNMASVSAVQTGGADADKAPESKFYTLKPGDTLWKIAKSEYGHGQGSKYHLIFEANKALLSRPGKLSPGQVLRIPPPSG